MKKTSLVALVGGAAIALGSLFYGTTMRGQVTPVINPDRYSFQAGADYDATFADGSKKVVSVSALVYDGATLVQTLPAGHPAKDASGMVVVGLSQGAIMQNDKNYTLAMRMINAFDTTDSDPGPIPLQWQNTKPGKSGAPKPCKGGSGPC